MHIRKLLVGFDGSEPANRALAMAEDLAREHEARIVLVSALQPYVAGAGMVAVPEIPTRSQLEAAQKEIDALAETMRARGNRIETQVEIGAPAATLLELADEMQVDVIVVGRSGRGAITRAFLGSVTTQLLHQSTRPLLVVP
jgi:nucleotide-binding universal stress UspA family protein